MKNFDELRSPMKRRRFPTLMVPMAFSSCQLSNGTNPVSMGCLDGQKSHFFHFFSPCHTSLSLLFLFRHWVLCGRAAQRMVPETVAAHGRQPCTAQRPVWWLAATSFSSLHFLLPRVSAFSASLY